jgi:hypothetical protein
MGKGPFQTRLLVTLIAIIALGFVASAAFTAADDPEPGHSGERRCTDFNASWSELEVDPVDDGNGTYSDGTLTVTVDFSQDTQLLDWTSNIGVDAVWMKGSVDAGSLYSYDPEATSGTGLHTPPKPGTDHFWSLNHALFCYDVESSTPTPTPSPSVSPTETVSPTPTPTPTGTTTPTPTPTVLPTETQSPTPTPSASVLPTETVRPTPDASVTVEGRKLGRTGADVMRWMLVGAMLLAIGILTVVVIGRTERRTG